ncbi:MAG: SAM-dependent methyltransferase [Gammaproteobacteria bacterium]
MSRPPEQISAFPEPGPEAMQHSRVLVERICEEIRDSGGHIPFRRFMELALYAPGLGYYSAGSSKLGAEGDFITAPELSSLFSRCIARQCERVMEQMEHCIIIEPGAGSGRMAADMLLELENRQSLPDAWWILETSAELRDRQHHILAQAMPHYMDRIEWLDRLPAQPVEGIIIANEVLDAFPFHCIRLSGGDVQELHVVCEDERFRWRAIPADDALSDYVRRILEPDLAIYPEGYTTEVNPSVQPFIASLSDILDKGVILFIDYGYPRREYYHPQRTEGTMLCHYRHRAHADPFLYVGLQDITASVDFTAVAEAAEAAGLDVRGFTPQAQFLLGGGLDDLLSEYADNPDAALEMARQVKLLTLPAEMGERFKAMLLSKNLSIDLPAFRMLDHRNRL